MTKVVGLGCGFGWFCRWAREQGAAHVLGLDLSERMLAQAIAARPELTRQRERPMFLLVAARRPAGTEVQAGPLPAASVPARGERSNSTSSPRI